MADDEYKDDLPMEIKRASGVADSLAFQRQINGMWKVFLIKTDTVAKKTVLVTWPITEGLEWGSVNEAVNGLQSLGYTVV